MTFGHEQNAIVGYRAQPIAVPMPMQVAIPSPQPPQPESPEAGLIQVVWRRKWIVMIVTLLCLAGGWFYLQKAPRIYTATAKVAIEPTASALASISSAEMGETYLHRQGERIKSAQVLQRAVSTYRLERLESVRENPVLLLREGLDIEVGRRHGLLLVSFPSKYPGEAVEIVNSVVQAYLTDHLIRSEKVQSKLVEILQTDLDKVNGDLAAAEQKLMAFVEANPGVSVDQSRGSVEYQRMQTYANQLDEARLQLIQAQAAELANNSVMTRAARQRAEVVVSELEGQLREMEEKYYKSSTLSRQLIRLEEDVRRLRDKRTMLESRIDEAMQNREKEQQIASIEVLEGASPDNLPFSPRKSRVLAIALAAGLVLGTGLGLLRDWMDQRLRSAEEVMATLGVPVLGTIPHMSRRLTQVQRGQKVFLDPMSEVAEAFRTVRTAVYFGARSDRAKTLLVTSAMPGDGKSTTASNLAIAMAQAGQRTLLLDCDFRKPTQHIIFEVDASIGVSTVLAGREPLDRAIQRTAVEGLDILPGGPIPLNPSEILNSQAFSDMVDELAVKYDHIVIDSPPVNAVTDARILGALCDITVVVLRAEKTMRKHSEYARDALMSVGARLLGCVVNDVSRNKSKSGFYSGYGYYGNAANAVTITQGPARTAVAPRRLIRAAQDVNGSDEA